MIKDSKYQFFTVEEFVEDPDFRQWVHSPTEILDSFWQLFQQEFPKKIEDIKKARQIVENLTFEERPIPSEVYLTTLESLKTYLARKNNQKAKGSKRRLFLWRSVAAILLLPLLAVGSYWVVNNYVLAETQVVQYIVPNGEKSNVVLADGTSVWLNSGSKLYYNPEQHGRMRKVRLVGEAFFDVARDKHRPFIVETNDYSVKVYGTQFNVRAYGDTKESETILKEGAITILSAAHGEIKMKPGERFLLGEDDKYSISRVNPDLYLSWKDNVLKINNEQLSDLIIQMERWYGVNIEVKNLDTVKSLRYTLTIKTESLREMLELMRFVTPFNYKIDGENVVLNYEI